MLTAKRTNDGKIVTAYMESPVNAPFTCVECGDPVLLKSGRSRINHFAHINPLACKFATGESDAHLKCKMEIFMALQKSTHVSFAALERPLATVRPDVSAHIHGTPVAIEVQVSDLSLESITYRTIEYARKGISVLWLLLWTPELDSPRYVPRLWEKWIHALYFGQIYYWIEGLTVVSYHFDPKFKTIPKKVWFSKDGKKMKGGGYSRKSIRYRTPVRGRTLNLVEDFGPKERFWWEGNGLKLPDAKLFMAE